jgi:hypothetical protein
MYDIIKMNTNVSESCGAKFSAQRTSLITLIIIKEKLSQDKDTLFPLIKRTKSAVRQTFVSSSTIDENKSSLWVNQVLT